MIVEVDDKVAKVRNIKVCFLSSPFPYENPDILIIFPVCLAIGSF